MCVSMFCIVIVKVIFVTTLFLYVFSTFLVNIDDQNGRSHLTIAKSQSHVRLQLYLHSPRMNIMR